jgi:hypothetical protein
MKTFTRLGSIKNISLGLVTVATFWLALDGHHYWHDVRFLYASTKFSLPDILSGAFNPHQFGGEIDELSASGFYLAKVLHIWLLQILFKLVPPAVGGFTLSIWLSIIGVGLSILISYRIFLRLFKNEHQAWLVVYCLLLMPIIPYLAGKLLSEVTALLMMSITLWAFVTALDMPNTHSKLLAGISGVFLLLTALARLDLILTFFGFFVALLLSVEAKEDRIKLLKNGGIGLVIFIAGYFSTIYALGSGVDALIRYFRDFTGAGLKSNAMSILGILTFGGMVYALALGVIFSQERKKTQFLAIWFLLSAGPAMLITRNYMVEPRYLTHGLLPLAGLGALGLEVLIQRITLVKFKGVVFAGLIVIIIAFNALVIRLMPYELDRPAIFRAVNQIQALDDQATILIPWAYTDFHFLHIMMPNASIINVNSVPEHPLEKAWQERFDRWYGETYIATPAELEPILMTESVYYLGWRKYPPVEYVKNITQSLGLEALSDQVDRLPLTDHLAESWVWYSPAYHLELAGKSGQYEYYKVIPR